MNLNSSLFISLSHLALNLIDLFYPQPHVHLWDQYRSQSISLIFQIRHDACQSKIKQDLEKSFKF